MTSRKLEFTCILLLVFCLVALPAAAQSFRVQCPTSTITHPLTGTDCVNTPTNPGCNNTEPAYNGPTQFTPQSQTAPGWSVPQAGTVNGAIKCQNVSGGDGYMTEGDGTQTFMFSFGPLSGLADIAAGREGTEFPDVFNTPIPVTVVRGDPAKTDGASTGASPGTAVPAASAAFPHNGAVGLTPDLGNVVTITDIVIGPPPAIPAPAPGFPYPTAPTDRCPGITYGSTTVTVYTDAPLFPPSPAPGSFPDGPIPSLQQPTVNIADTTPGDTTLNGFTGPYKVTCVYNSGSVINPSGQSGYLFTYNDTNTTTGNQTGLSISASASSPSAQIDGHVDPRPIMDIGVMNGNIPGPLVAFDEDDEMFLTLTNVGMIMRPDLFEQHTFHFHGYPNASSFYDGVPDASVAINIGASFTYYYLAPDAGTYFYHCHITPPEHLQMGMVNQLYIRPRQDRVPQGGSLYTYLGYQNGVSEPGTNPTADPRTVCNTGADILCSATMPAGGATANPALRAAAGSLCGSPTMTTSGLTPDYVYNDGDGSTCYDVTYPIQMHGFDPNFHFVGMTFNPEMFADMKDKYFLLNGRSYPDTIAAGPQATVSSDGTMHYSQPMPAIINIPAGGRASLRLVNLSVAEYFTLQTLGVPMHVVGWNAKLLRDQAGSNTEYWSNSITLGGGESNDVILDASDNGCGSVGCAAALYPAGSTFYLYSPNLDFLSNDAENFGGMMTEVHICNSVSGGNTFGNTCN